MKPVNCSGPDKFLGTSSKQAAHTVTVYRQTNKQTGTIALDPPTVGSFDLIRTGLKIR